MNQPTVYLKCRCWVTMEPPITTERLNEVATNHAKETGHEVWYEDDPVWTDYFRKEPTMDMATAHKMVTDILMRNFMPKEIQRQVDEPHVVLIRRGVATVTDEIFAIMEQLYNPQSDGELK